MLLLCRLTDSGAAAESVVDYFSQNRLRFISVLDVHSVLCNSQKL